MKKFIQFFNRTKEEITAAYNRLKQRYGKYIHYGHLEPVKGNSLLYQGWFTLSR